MANLAELQLQIRRGTAAAWTTADPTLLAGEWGYETDTNLIKIGDGSTAWTSLGYWGTFQDIFMRAPETADPTANDTITSSLTFNSYDGNQYGFFGYDSNDALELKNFAYEADVVISVTDALGNTDYNITLNNGNFSVNLDVSASAETILDLTTSTTLALSQAVIFVPTFIDGFHLEITSPAPYLRLNNTGAPVDTRLWDSFVDASGNYILRTRNDADSSGNTAIQIGRTGIVIDSLDLTATAITANGTLDATGVLTAQAEAIMQQAFRAAYTATAAATLTLDATHYTVNGTLAGNQTFTLPTAVGITGRIYNIKKTGASGTITVDTTSSETIDGSLTATLTVQYENLTVQSDGANWIIL